MADITVQVTSPGTLTTWGESTFGSSGFGGLIGLSSSSGSADAYNTTGWGRLTWGSLVWGQDFISVTVSVTTPGTPTTWSQSTFGNYSWGQITGAQVEQGEESLIISADVPVSTNLINSTVGTVFAAANFIEILTGVTSNITVNSVFAGENLIVQVTTPGTSTTWGQSSWGSGAWNQISGTLIEQGDESITGTGVIDLTGNQLNTTTGTFSITGTANLTLSTNLLNTTVGSVAHVIDVVVSVTSPGELPWGSESWGYGTWGNIGGMDISQGGEEVVVPSVEVDVIGNQLNTTIGTYSIIANANVNASTNLLTISLGDEDVTPNTIVNLSTNLLTISLNDVYAATITYASPTGVEMTTNTGRLFISAWAVVDIGITNTWKVVDIAA